MFKNCIKFIVFFQKLTVLFIERQKKALKMFSPEMHTKDLEN